MPEIPASRKDGGWRCRDEALDELTRGIDSEHGAARRASDPLQRVFVEARVGHFGIHPTDQHHAARSAEPRLPARASAEAR